MPFGVAFFTASQVIIYFNMIDSWAPKGVYCLKPIDNIYNCLVYTGQQKMKSGIYKRFHQDICKFIIKVESSKFNYIKIFTSLQSFDSSNNCGNWARAK